MLDACRIQDKLQGMLNDFIIYFYLLHLAESQANFNSAKVLNLRDTSMKHKETEFLRSLVLDAGGKTEGPRENLWKQVVYYN